MWSTFFILGQLLTLVSYLIFWISRFLKSKNNILLLDNISRLFAIISFIFLGTYDGIKNTLYVILRNVLGQVTNKKKQKYKTITFLLIYALILSKLCLSNIVIHVILLFIFIPFTSIVILSHTNWVKQIFLTFK